MMSGQPRLFSLGERLGIFLTVEASLLSAASVTFILCYALYRRIRSTLYTSRRKDLRFSRPSESDATSSGLFLNLMLADLIQAFGNLPDIKWMTAGAVLPGKLCTAQAVLKQVGIVGVAMTSLAIALHTFSILVLQWKGPPNFPKYVIIGIWTFIAFDVGLANLIHRKEIYYGGTGYWCWILPRFEAEGIVTEYLWVWLAGLSMIILYGIMFAIIRRWFKIAHGIHWYNQPGRGALDTESEDDRKIKAVANSLLFYPAVYIFCVFPNTLSRWLYFTNGLRHPPPYQFTLFASSIYGLSGVFNLILFFFTRPTVVMGHSVTPNDIASPIHRRHDSEFARNSLQKRPRSDYDYGLLSTDIENPSRSGSTFDLQSPSRTKHRTRSSYDFQVVVPSSSPTRYPGTVLGVLDIS